MCHKCSLVGRWVGGHGVYDQPILFDLSIDAYVATISRSENFR